MSDDRQRRSSLLAGLLLILLGLIFLADRFYPHFGLGHLIRLYWPVLIILWGVAKLFDHMSAQRAGEPRGPLLSGGEAALLILLALVLATFVFRDWIRDEFPGIEIHVPAFRRSFSRTQSLPPATIPTGAHVAIETDRGDIRIVGIDGNQLRVNVRGPATGGNGAGPGAKPQEVNAVVDRNSNGYRIHPINQSGWRSSANIDFDVQVPKTALVDANAFHGDIEIHNTSADVSAESQNGNVRIANVAGNVQVRGRGQDLDVTDVAGDVAVDGNYLGDTHIRRVGGMIHIKSARDEIIIAQLTGELALDSGDLSISSATGPIKIATRDKDVAIQAAANRLDVANSHGDTAIHFVKPPRDGVSITGDSGDVELTLPAQSTFQLDAVSRSGEVECEFENPAVRRAQESEVERIDGTFGGTFWPSSGPPPPKISIATSYGAIHVNKSK